MRGFTQDDGHIFCTEEQIQPEVTAFNRQALAVYEDFGFTDVAIKIALRPDKRLGSDETWDRAENALRAGAAGLRRRMDRASRRGRVLRPQGRISPQGLDRPVVAMRNHADGLPDARPPRRRVRRPRRHPQGPRDAAPGDRRLARALHRDPDRELRRRPAALARPVQAVVLNITDRQAGYAREIEARLRTAGLRVRSDLRNEKITYKIREHSLQKLPYQLIVGDKEMQALQVAVRTRGGEDLGAMPVDALLARLREEVAARH